MLLARNGLPRTTARDHPGLLVEKEFNDTRSFEQPIIAMYEFV
jgi:hypothetical protein